ncbi:DUF4194 domain-containing protein [Myceligenerans pegani]|uniref:DUF4194 domain-containing protein n=1 Tax=Myceligenerans pegani TaxID=2776917 RepID=A0ABR9MY33_9MICO|nr:DUF4194 domain-containing protein [Myceligenerans sp. TRM 65318]MBE1876297.1 DUF4194 domain-containing protein [Myceligenerans sp. TRM 65318]MBE3018568.1 DUF4194 domain-containing protein [Myceligenerans sp. TRM 65318]
MTGPMEHLSNSRPGGSGPARVVRPGRPDDTGQHATAPVNAPGVPPSSGIGTGTDEPTARLWQGDPGTLPAAARRALAALVRGPYLSAADDDETWRDLLTHLDTVHARLADMYLDVVVDHDEQIAFVRDAASAPDAPPVVREVPLAFLDTVLLLHLRTRLLESPGQDVVVDLDDVVDHLHAFRRRGGTGTTGYGTGFDVGIAAGWDRLVDTGILRPAGPGRRCVVSPVLRTLFGADEIQAVQAEYARLSREGL